MKKLGLSAYENDSKPTDKKFAYIIDESIMVNREKLLLILGVPAEHPGRPLKHEDVTVVSMKSGGSFKSDDIKQEIEKSIKEIKAKPEYVISDQAHNLTNGISQSELLHHIDISHAILILWILLLFLERSDCNIILQIKLIFYRPICVVLPDS